MRIAALKIYWPFSTSADPSAPQSLALSDVPEPCPKVRLATLAANSVTEECPSTVSTNTVHNACPNTLSAKGVRSDTPHVASQRADGGVGKRSRRKRAKIGQLYEEDELSKAEITAGVHAACLLLDVALTRPHLVGTWITKDQLSRWYEERVARDGGKAQSWALIARALKKWTASDRRTRRAKKRTYYKIPTITPELKKYAEISHSLPPAEAEDCHRAPRRNDVLPNVKISDDAAAASEFAAASRIR